MSQAKLCCCDTPYSHSPQINPLNLSHFWPLPLIPTLLLPLPLSYNSSQIPFPSLLSACTSIHHCLSQGFGGVWEVSLELFCEHTDLRCWLPSQPAFEHLQQPLNATGSLTTHPDPHLQPPTSLGTPTPWLRKGGTQTHVLMVPFC